ncbi:MAG TPA: hypothetical protein EYP10_05750, partial [Armatimonadetes bacterium]|nr:hypothetical protein [Armatimonadota bacterium]
MWKRERSERGNWLEQLTPAIVILGFIILLIGIAIKYARPQPKWIWGAVTGIGAALLIGILIARFDAV